jgi:universal stress protein E
MPALANLLVAIDHLDDAPAVLEKAARLATATRAKTHIVRVAYEAIAELGPARIDDLDALKTYVLQAEEQALEDAVDAHRGAFASLETTAIWNKRTSDGVLHVAELVGADLVMKATRGPEGIDVTQVPDDWNLLRRARCPVLMVKPDAWVENPIVLAAVNSLDDEHADVSRALLRRARTLTDRLGGRLHVVNAYPMFERWRGEFGAGVDVAKLVAAVEEEIARRVDALAGDVVYEQLHVREGRADLVIRQLAEETRAEIVVLGTAARSGVKGLVVGNTSEIVLPHVAADVLVVPPP